MKRWYVVEIILADNSRREVEVVSTSPCAAKKAAHAAIPISCVIVKERVIESRPLDRGE